jgi:hypothetical protein
MPNYTKNPAAQSVLAGDPVFRFYKNPADAEVDPGVAMVEIKFHPGFPGVTARVTDVFSGPTSAALVTARAEAEAYAAAELGFTEV